MKIKEGLMYSVGKSKIPIHSKGFNTQEIRTYKKINKDRTEVLKGAGHTKLVSH